MKKGSAKPKYEVALEYGVSTDTLRQWIKPFLSQLKNYNKFSKKFTPAQLVVIYEILGEPENENL